MALPRKSAQQVAARELARERASAYLAQQERLLDLAVDFNLVQEEIDQIAAAKVARLAAIEAEYQAETAQRVERLGQLIAAMADQGAKVADIAARLGQKPANVKRWLATTAPAVNDAEVASPTTEDHGQAHSNDGEGTEMGEDATEQAA